MRQLSGGMKDYSFFAASFVLSKYNGHNSPEAEPQLLSDLKEYHWLSEQR